MQRTRRRQWEGPQRSRARRAGAGVAVLAAAALVAVTAGLLVRGSDSSGLTVTRDTPPAPAQHATTPEAQPVAPAVGAWEPRRPAPVAARTGHSVTWAGDELVVWGGRSPSRHLDDGAAYDQDADRWRAVADAPIRGRTDHAAVWTGDEVLVWGGRRTDDFGPLALADGAAYDPETDTWRPLPDAPVEGRWSPTAVWTGDELLVWGGRAQRLRSVYLGDGAAYDPAGDTWRPLADPPSRARWSPAAAWTGEELLVWGAVSASRATTSGIRYRPGDDAWRHLGAAPLPVAVPAVAAWDGTAALVFTPYETLSYDLEQNRWARSSAVPLAVRATTRALATDEGVLVVDRQHSRGAVVDAGSVRPLPDQDEPQGQRAGARVDAAWTGGSLLVVGGAEAGDRLAIRAWIPSGEGQGG